MYRLEYRFRLFLPLIVFIVLFCRYTATELLPFFLSFFFFDLQGAMGFASVFL